MRFALLVAIFGSQLFGQSTSPVQKTDTPKTQNSGAIEAITQFEQALEKQNVALIEPLVTTDLVVFENGEVNRGWTDFRDNHLTPEFSEPAPQMDRKVVKVKVDQNMAWGYTEGAFMSTDKKGNQTSRILYTIYVLERRSEQWKIVSLTWSLKPR
jgi:ketosteroid isomerase-like protein